MASKDWKHPRYNLWIHIKNENKVVVVPPFVSALFNNNWLVNIYKRKSVSTKQFEKREQALKFAKAYIRKH